MDDDEHVGGCEADGEGSTGAEDGVVVSVVLTVRSANRPLSPGHFTTSNPEAQYLHEVLCRETVLLKSYRLARTNRTMA